MEMYVMRYRIKISIKLPDFNVCQRGTVPQVSQHLSISRRYLVKNVKQERVSTNTYRPRVWRRANNDTHIFCLLLGGADVLASWTSFGIFRFCRICPTCDHAHRTLSGVLEESFARFLYSVSQHQASSAIMTEVKENPELSPTSPVDDSDAVLSPVAEPEPIPGLDGVPVRWYDADRTEPYTRITPYQERHDTSVEFFYKPITLTALAFGLIILAYVAMTQDVLEEGQDKRRVGVYAAIVSFLMFSMLQFRDGPFIRPHPAFWRMILGINLLYELALVFLLFQDLASARTMMTFIDPNLGIPLPEKSYAEDCTLTPRTIWNALDIFCVAHTLGWFGKAMILRDYWFCWILSIAFELAEYSLQHQLANFAECWWDHWILDVLLCNWIGTYLGMKTCQYFEVKPYEWRGLRQTRGLRSKARRVLSQFSPHDFTAFKWGTASSFTHFSTVVLLLAVFLAAELNPFYLKSLLWMEPDHPVIILRLAFVFLCALPAVRELFQYINDPRRAVRMGQHVWLLLATIATELLVITKWSQGQFPEPLPTEVKWGWAIGATLLVLYPTVQFGAPSARKYIRKHQRKGKAKGQ